MNAANNVDKLGMLMAQITDLMNQANEIKAELKANGVGVTEGNLFRAVVVEVERVTYDNEILRAVADPAILELARREAMTMQVRMTARKAA